MSARGLLVAALIALIAVVGALAWPGRDGPVGRPGESTIVMDDYSFSPRRLSWRAGERITLTILNRSSSQPGAAHEIMFGRWPLREDGILGPVQGDGFEEQLLDGVTIELLAGDGVTMIMAETARLTGVDPMSLMPPGMDMGPQAMRPGMDFMAVVSQRGSLTFRFQVPDRPGEWEFGCFAQDGQHYLNGMRGIITVAAR
ncbi:MAG: hypothetical protein ACLGIJ_13800 [Candidatus Limnocylindria bacterium]